jgi:hypothetical protein
LFGSEQRRTTDLTAHVNLTNSHYEIKALRGSVENDDGIVRRKGVSEHIFNSVKNSRLVAKPHREPLAPTESLRLIARTTNNVDHRDV